MQQTKRRSKKGVILLALALALFVLAIVPASALAAPATIEINGVMGPAAVTVGSNLVNVKYHSDLLTANYVTFAVAPGPGYAYGAESSPRKAYTATSWDTETISLGAGLLPGDTFKVKVTFYAASSGGSALEAAVSGVITYDNTKSVSVLDWDGYGARGDIVPIAPVPPGPPFADYSRTWFGPGWDAGHAAVGPYQTAQGDFYVFGAPAHSVVYQVDDLYTGDIEVGGPFPYTPIFPFANPIPFYDITGILKSNGFWWSGSPAVRDGFHWVDHYAVATTGAVPYGPESRAPFGWDSVVPRWTINGLDAVKWHGNAAVPWDALVSDNPGSGVETATVIPEYANDTWPLAADGIIGTSRLEWTWWQAKASGSLVPKTHPTDPLSWTDTWDANFLHDSVDVSFNSTDAVQNVGNVEKHVWFDLIAPHTTHTSEPADATSFLWDPHWTNTDVKVIFHASDPGFDDGWASGVDYTEYVIGSSTSTPPGSSTTGTKAVGGSVTITQNAPTGPVYLWFRSVDKAVPANKEVWQKIFVYIDKAGTGTAGSTLASNGPFLTNDVPSWWINDGYGRKQDTDGAKGVTPVVVPVLFGFDVTFDATDPNSGIGPDLIWWRVLNWLGDAGYGTWHQVAPLGSAPFTVHAMAADDGIYSLESKVSDRAGNETTKATPLKVDTRPPVTDGAAGWINGLVPYVLNASDQAIGAGVAATVYRVDQSTPWLVNAAGTVGTTLDTNITLSGGQGAIHTVDFGSVDAALPYGYDATVTPYKDKPSYVFGNLEGTSWIWNHTDGFIGFTGYKTRNVKLDVTAPVVTAMDPKNGNWQKGPGVVNFSGTDVGAGYDYTEWSTDGGATWTKGEVAEVGGDGEITVTYHGVDKVGIKSADQTIVVKVASTPPTVTGGNVSVKKGQKATFVFNVTCVTPKAQVIIQIRTKSGKTVSTHHYASVDTNVDGTRSFKVNIKKGKYNIRIGAVDEAGNVQTKRGGGTLTVK